MGQADNQHWGQVHLSPYAYGIIEVYDADGEARQHGVKFLSELSHKLNSHDIDEQTLTNAIQSMYEKTAQTLAVLTFGGQKAHIVLRGQGHVYLKRGEKLAKLIVNEGFISGELMVGDTILLVSKGFVDAVSDAELMSVFDHQTPQDVAEKLTLMLHETDSGIGASALVLHINEVIVDELQSEGEPLDEPEQDSVVEPEKSSSVAARLKQVKPRAVGLLKKLGSKENRKKSLIGFLALSTGLLFVTSVLLGIRKQTLGATDQKVVTAMKDARFIYEEGTALLELNAIKSRERLTEAKMMLEPYLAEIPEKSPSGRELRQLYSDITSNLTHAMKVYVVNPELFYDVSLLKKGAIATAVSLDKETLGMLDRQSGTLYTVSLGTKKGEMVASGNDIIGSIFVAILGNTLYTQGEKGVVEVNIASKKPELVVQKPEQWKLPVALAAYDVNVYILDSAAGRIWKYVSSRDGFSETREYLNPDSFPDLSTAVSLSIDGSLWVTTGNGRILKFSGGSEETFEPVGVDPAFTGPIKIYTSETTNNLYILDDPGKRVVVLAKDGTYLAQYTWGSPLSVVDFVVSESTKVILLLSEGKILAIPIQ